MLPAYFYPETEPGMHLADNRNEAFAQAGFKMVVHTPAPTRGISESERRKFRKKTYELQYDGSMEIYRFRMFREGRSTIVRAIRYSLCCVIQFIKGLVTKDVQVIFVSSTPPIQGFMASILSLIKKVPFVYCLQDIFPDSLISTGITKKGSILWKVGIRIEKFTYQHADKIIVISEDFKRNLMAKGIPEHKIEVIYNWVDENTVVPVTRIDNKIIKKYGLNPDLFYITYCGNLGHTQNLEMLVEVAKEMEKHEKLHFIIIGDGACKPKLIEKIDQMGLKNIALLPFQPYEDISHVFSLGDAGLVISKTGVGINSVPSKIWSIMSAERPVLMSFDENEITHLIRDNACGRVALAENKEALKEAILLLMTNRTECEQMGRNGRNFILENLTRALSTVNYVNVIREFDLADKTQ